MCCLTPFVSCKLNTTKHAYPLLWAKTLEILHSACFNAWQYLHTNAAARASLLCMSAFPKNVLASLPEKSPSAFQPVNLIKQCTHILFLWAKSFKKFTPHTSMHCSISTPTPQLVLLCCAFPPFPKNVLASLLEKSPSAFQPFNLIQQSMHIHRFGPTPSNIALCMLQCIAVSPHQCRSSCLSAVHFRLSEQYSSFAAREISIRLLTFQLHTTKRAYPLRWANPSNIALCMLQCIAVSQHQHCSSCHSAVNFRLSEKCSSFAAGEISLRFSTCQLH